GCVVVGVDGELGDRGAVDRRPQGDLHLTTVGIGGPDAHRPEDLVLLDLAGGRAGDLDDHLASGLAVAARWKLDGAGGAEDGEGGARPLDDLDRLHQEGGAAHGDDAHVLHLLGPLANQAEIDGFGLDVHAADGRAFPDEADARRLLVGVVALDQKGTGESFLTGRPEDHAHLERLVGPDANGLLEGGFQGEDALLALDRQVADLQVSAAPIHQLDLELPGDEDRNRPEIQEGGTVVVHVRGDDVETRIDPGRGVLGTGRRGQQTKADQNNAFHLSLGVYSTSTTLPGPGTASPAKTMVLSLGSNQKPFR